LRWIRKDNEKPYIEPGGTATFEVEVLGRPGLTSALVQIDYASIGVPMAEVQDKFHTRQVSLPLTITVNASVELAKMDVLPLTGNIPRSLWSKIDSKRADDEPFAPEDYCLLVLDLRNAWPNHLHVHLDITNGDTIDEEILPGNTSRIVFPIRRVFLEDPYASIPALDPSRQRQFVVSTGRISADSERTARESFWYREEILGMLHGTWATKTGPHRNGEIELRGIKLSQRMIEAIKIDDIGIDLWIDGSDSAAAKYELLTDIFSELRVRIHNRSSEAVYPLLRLQPSIRNHLHSASLDLTKKLVWNGVLQQTLPPLRAKESIEIGVGVTALARGEFEIGASVEEAFLHDPPIRESGEGRPRANTKSMMDAVLGTRERRIWHAREPCLVTVMDGDGDSDDDDDE
jgi:hypothetical protein